MELSLVIPVFNEENNINPLLDAIMSSLSGVKFEVILVDDGSSDNTVNNIKLYKNQDNIKLIRFRRNFGQTSAMAAGIDAAQGRYIATLDGDLQNDPDDIIMMLNLLKERKVDMVCGIRENRQDKFLLRKFPSKIANFLIRKLSGVNLQDYGCTLKIFRSNLAKKLELYGELHRFIPILASLYGAKIIEIGVKHHPRIFGNSKYGIGRTTKVISDLLLMVFMLKYRQKPMHLFGNLGIISLALGGISGIYLLILKLLGNSITDKPLFYVMMMLIIGSVQLITGGFIAELLMRTYFDSKHKKPYEIVEEEFDDE